MATALDLFKDALSLTNALGVGQELTADESQTCLRVANRMLDNWSTQSLTVYGQADQTFNTVAAQATYTIGPTGNWVTTRPIHINDPAYTTYQSVSFPMLSMTPLEYDLIYYKTQPGVYPYRYLYSNDMPNGTITLWPVPSGIVPVTFTIERVLTTLTNLNTVFAFPPGYEQAFVYNLAILLGPQFGVEMSNYPDTKEIAASSLGDIKRANAKQSLRVMRSGTEYSDPGRQGSPYGWMVWP
jgi:hypothetical protein